MGLSQCLFLFFIFFFKGCNTSTNSHEQQPFNCHDEESSALLQFSQSFTINASALGLDGAYPKMSSWKPAQGRNGTCCCIWDGVECDEETGHVIGLNLSSSCLYGSINSNSSLFRLVHLQSLNLAHNHFNYSQIPTTIKNFPSLTHLDLSYSVFSGKLPSELSQLVKLSTLDLSSNALSGPLYASLSNLTNLTYLSLENNNFNGGPLLWVGKLTKLTELHLSDINLIGDIPSSLENLTQLTHFDLSYNHLTGPIPSWVGNLSRLVSLHLRFNELNGSIPESLFNLRDLNALSLEKNFLTGVVDIFKVQNLTFLTLSGNNKLEMITESRTMNATALPMFKTLGLRSCDIKEFPSFLRYQQKLRWLDLRGNKLNGNVPKWMWNTSTQILQFLDLSYNFLSGFDQPSPVILPWVNLKALLLHSNMLSGPVPIPPSNIIYYAIDDNKLVEEIPPMICNLSTLRYLDLSNNKLSGMLPQCLGNFSDELRVLHLRNNYFRGTLPQIYTTNLRMIDVGDNKLQGRLPNSLANCTMLEFIDLSENQFNDVFPFWLGNLPELKLLAMKHNRFYGVIENTKKILHFPELRILDISNNNFRGDFPSEYIFSGNAMRGVAQSQPTYMETSSDVNISGAPSFSSIFTITIKNKGVERYYEKIREDIGVVDISSNNFEGNIPEFIGNLKGLRFLSISHNSFTGSIPSVLGNLTLLESLDLSQNQLSGVIPQQLAQLTTLAYFNVSYNNLTGSVPQGPQFQTFESTSFEGNPGLCGDQLPKKCGNSKTPAPPPPSSTEEDDSGSGIEFDWKFVLAGFGSGLLVGVVLADVAITRKRELFLEIVGMLIKLIKRIRSKN